jgi:hypothetical protein
MAKQDNFPAVFDQLKTLLQPYVPPLLVKADTPDNYYLEAPPSARYPKGLFVGAVQIKKNYVSYHLMPIYMFPDLLDSLSPALKKRMQGKACFNFTAMDAALFQELAELTATGIARARQAPFAPEAGVPA